MDGRDAAEPGGRSEPLEGRGGLQRWIRALGSHQPCRLYGGQTRIECLGPDPSAQPLPAHPSPPWQQLHSPGQGLGRAGAARGQRHRLSTADCCLPTQPMATAGGGGGGGKLDHRRAPWVASDFSGLPSLHLLAGSAHGEGAAPPAPAPGMCGRTAPGMGSVPVASLARCGEACRGG